MGNHPRHLSMAKCRVVKGGWWWYGVERCVGDVLEASDVQVAQWAADGLAAPIAEIETATQPAPETAVLKRKRNK